MKKRIFDWVWVYRMEKRKRQEGSEGFERWGNAFICNHCCVKVLQLPLLTRFLFLNFMFFCFFIIKIYISEIGLHLRWRVEPTRVFIIFLLKRVGK